MIDEFYIGARIDIDSYRYNVRRVVQGGMGLVLLCESMHNNKLSLLYEEKIAAKVFYPDSSQAQIRTELRIWQNLRHKNIVPLMAIAHANDWLCATMPWYEDGAVSFEGMRKNGGLKNIKKMLLQVGQALDYAHAKQSILHLDIKPSNILSDGASFLLADWGISKISAKSALKLGPTSGGTLPYMSPERFSNEPDSVFADIYSLGMTAFELLTGRLPFDARNTDDLVQSIVSGKYFLVIRAASKIIPPGWMTFVLKCCQPNPIHRISTYSEFFNIITALEE